MVFDLVGDLTTGLGWGEVGFARCWVQSSHLMRTKESMILTMMEFWLHLMSLMTFGMASWFQRMWVSNLHYSIDSGNQEGDDCTQHPLAMQIQQLKGLKMG